MEKKWSQKKKRERKRNKERNKRKKTEEKVKGKQAGKLNIMSYIQEEKEGASKMLISAQHSDSGFIPHSTWHIALHMYVINI